jgi:hypothetical protein
LAACRRPTCQLYTELLDLLFLQTFSTTHLCMVNVRCLLSLCYPSPSFVFLSVSIPSPTKTKHFPLPLSPSPLASYFSLFHPSLHCLTLHHRIFFTLHTFSPPLCTLQTCTCKSANRLFFYLYRSDPSRGSINRSDRPSNLSRHGDTLLLWVFGGCFGAVWDSNGPITWHNRTDYFFSCDVVRGFLIL